MPNKSLHCRRLADGPKKDDIYKNIIHESDSLLVYEHRKDAFKYIRRFLFKEANGNDVYYTKTRGDNEALRKEIANYEKRHKDASLREVYFTKKKARFSFSDGQNETTHYDQV